MTSYPRTDLAELKAFTAIVRHRSFKGAAIELGLTASALSHTMRRLETKLGARLLNRTSRSVAPTVLGLELAERLEAGFEVIDEALQAVAGEKAAALGELRLNVLADAALLLLRPALPIFATHHPDARLTVSVENRPVDIVAEGFDAGIRYGDTVPQDMIAVALTPPLRWVMVASPDYLAKHGRPRDPADLHQQRCIRLLLGNNAIYRWELGDDERLIRVDASGPLTFNDTQATLDAARSGLGIGYLLEARAREDIVAGRLEIVLPEWASTGTGFHMYYPSRRQNHPALRRLIAVIQKMWRTGVCHEPESLSTTSSDRHRAPQVPGGVPVPALRKGPRR